MFVVCLLFSAFFLLKCLHFALPQGVALFVFWYHLYMLHNCMNVSLSTVIREIFVVKKFSYLSKSTKIKHTKYFQCTYYIIERELNYHRVRKIFNTKTFYTQIFLNTKISPTTVSIYQYVYNNVYIMDSVVRSYLGACIFNGQLHPLTEVSLRVLFVFRNP